MTSFAHHRDDLQRVAHRALRERGLLDAFDGPALEQLDGIRGPSQESGADIRDLRGLPWCSIDNDESKDLDQLSAALDVGDGSVRIFVAIADVDSLVDKGTPIDGHAAQNTASVYVAGQVYPMLPEKLSTDLTSLGQGVDRISIVVEYVVRAEGSLAESEVSRALVRNHAKLTYNAVADWLDGHGPLPEAAALVQGMDAQIRIQDTVAGRLRELRHKKGALDFASLEARPVFKEDSVVGMRAEKPNRAKKLIEEFMIAGNGVAARFLEAKGRPALRRVVRSPERWTKIVDVAAELGESLPGQPSARALEAFLAKRRAADPLRFPDLSLVIVKLMGAGEYVAELPGDLHVGHFGLSVKDYTHATAPNRRFSDLVTQRLLKAALGDQPSPYGIAELEAIAGHCTLQEGNISKVERQVHKSAAVLLLEKRVGESFDGLVTGAADKGTWVRILDPPAEGRVVQGAQGLRVGDKVRVTLLSTDFERGFLDFARAR
jgi:VacB/RNase II family 3'-5' exoribonuclease